MSQYSCLTCGAPRPEIARYKNDRELRLLNQLAGHQAAPKVPLEGQRKVFLAIGVAFMVLGLVVFGLYVGGVEIPQMSATLLTLIPLVIGLVIFFTTLWRANRLGW
jgi:hypothetical protein